MLLRELRERASLSQEQLAHQAGVTASTVHKLETGKVRPSYQTLTRLSEVLGVPIGDIEFPPYEPTKKDAA